MATLSGLIGLTLISARAYAAPGEQPNEGTPPATQAPPTDVAMSPDACQALIKQNQGGWQNYSAWSKYAADRNAHWNRDGIALALANIKHFSKSLNDSERKDINEFLSGTSGDVTSITRSLDAANTRLAILSATVVNGGSDDPDTFNPEKFRIQFKVTNSPRSIKILNGGRYRYDFDYDEMKEVEKKYPPVAITLYEQTIEGHPEVSVNNEQAMADKMANDVLKRNIANTTRDKPHYATEKEYMVGQKIVPAVCYIKPKPPTPPAVTTKTKNQESFEQWIQHWDDWGNGYRSGGAFP